MRRKTISAPLHLTEFHLPFRGGKEFAMLSGKELTALEDQINYEQTLVKKYATYSQQCQDPVLKEKCARIADRHRQHFNTLMTYLQ